MSEEANDLIERMEKETGCRVDDNGGNNMAIAGLFGVMMRETGKSKHEPRDDVAAGVLARHQLTPEFKREQEANETMASMLAGGMSPDDLYGLRKK